VWQDDTRTHCGRSARVRLLDDPAALAAAKADPSGFVAELPARTILDEVQRVPEPFSPLKLAVDRRRTPGRFLLTGSANVLLLPRIAESLAGRVEILRLHPLAQSEIAGRRPRFLDALFAGSFKTRRMDRLGPSLAQRVVAGGYPAALARPAARRRAAWYRDYLETLVQRDVRELARIRSLEVLPRLLTLAAGQTGRLLNVADLSTPFQVSRPTIREYMTLLERVFLLEELSPWHSNRLSRLVKTPKMHLGDTGLACALLGMDVAALTSDRMVFGQILETFACQELRRQASWHEHEIRLHHFVTGTDTRSTSCSSAGHANWPESRSSYPPVWPRRTFGGSAARYLRGRGLGYPRRQ